MSDEPVTSSETPVPPYRETQSPEPQPDTVVSRPPVFGAAQRLIESAAVAIVTSTGLYLVGSVYTQAFYGRMSIDAASLDLSPPHIALQSAHVLQSLLEYPSTLLVFYLLYRMLAARLGRVRSWYDRGRQRFGRLFLLLFNGVIVSPLVVAAFQASLDEGLSGASSVLGEVGGLMGTIGTLLVIYVIWLSFGPREDIISQIRQRKIIPIALLFALYLLDALVSTADGAAFDAELLMTGQTDSSIAIQFTWSADTRDPVAGAELILVTVRGGSYYVVERQAIPPSRRPVAYAIPVDAVDAARMQRINEADTGLEEFLFEMMATPPVPPEP
jgi:hypothetical protein